MAQVAHIMAPHQVEALIMEQEVPIIKRATQTQPGIPKAPLSEMTSGAGLQGQVAELQVQVARDLEGAHSANTHHLSLQKT